MLNPGVQQKELQSFNEKENILSTAYSPLARGEIFEINELAVLAKKYGKTEAQIVLRWSLQHGLLPLPKSANKNRIKENIDLFDFELSKEDMKKIDSFEGLVGEMENPDEKPY